ncbi:MAG: hypothetical protein IPN95_17315 [Bacteroidetes bacterium]|nr:hypothetical protein [Bacteroidota bacterium]
MKKLWFLIVLMAATLSISAQKILQAGVGAREKREHFLGFTEDAEGNLFEFPLPTLRRSKANRYGFGNSDVEVPHRLKPN